MSTDNRALAPSDAPLQSHDTLSDATSADILGGYYELDRGDQMQRNLRYQHAYVAMLILAAHLGDLDYVAIWCEHHEDALAETQERLFDAFQIKTSSLEQGAWKAQDPEFRRSVCRFAELERHYGTQIRTFHFVSNVDCLRTTDSSRQHQSPHHLVDSCRHASRIEDLDAPAQKALMGLATHCSADPTLLLRVLARTKLVTSMGRDSCRDELAHRVLPKLDGYSELAPWELDRIADALIHLVAKASALVVDDATKYWHDLMHGHRLDPRVAAKRISIDDAITHIADYRDCPFPLAGTTIRLLNQQHTLDRMTKKMVRGGLALYVDTMRYRARAAERKLLALAAKDPQKCKVTVEHLATLVKGECDDAALEVAMPNDLYGPEMLRLVTTRLRNLAKERPEMALSQEPECLIGIAGLLTDECTVWWSDRFEVETSA